MPSSSNTLPSSKYKFLLSNVRGFLSKKSQLELLLASFPTIAVFTEIFLSDNCSPNDVKIPCYESRICCRVPNQRKSSGGGVAIFFPDNLYCEQVGIHSSLEFDAITCFLQNEDKEKILITAVYRGPGICPTFCTKFHEYIDSIRKSCPHVITGDLNMPDIDWKNLTAQNGMSRGFTDIAVQKGWKQLVKSPTRLTNILDLILIDSPNIIESVKVTAPISDHNKIEGSINFRKVNKVVNQTRFRDFKNANYDDLQRELCLVDWDYRFSTCANPDEYYNVFLNILNKFIHQYVPLREKKSRTIPRHLLQLRRKCERAFIKMKKHPIENNVKQYKLLFRDYKNEIRSTFLRREQKICNNKNIKEFWNYVRSKNTIQSEIPPISSNGNVLFHDTDIANEFNTYFTSVFAIDNSKRFEPEPKSSPNIGDFEIPAFAIYEKLKKMKPKLSYGADDIPTIFYQKLALALSYPLSLIFKISLNSGMLPEIWKKSIVVPIHKKNAKDKVENYRPISLTCVSCRIMESFLVNRIRKHLWDKNLISEAQFGFLNNRNTVTQLLEFQQFLINEHTAKKNIDVVYLDISKAFDTVCHRRLKKILLNYGINGSIYNWLNSFLSQRTQLVRINDSFSTPSDVISGVPQGSCLGPLLFLLYINDAKSALKFSQFLMYADDCKLYLSSSSQNYNQRLQSDLKDLHSWFENRQLQLAADKCNVLHIGKQNVGYQYELNNILMKKVSSVKDLGLNISNNLKVTNHVRITKRKCMAIVNGMFRNFSFSKSNFVTCFKSLVIPILEYACEAFINMNKTDAIILESVQRYFTKRIIPNSTYERRLQLLKLEPLWLRRIVKDLSLAHKYVYGYIFSKDIFHLYTTSNRNSQLRGNGIKLALPTMSEVKNKFVTSRITKIWNSLPSEIVFEHNNCKFQKSLKLWFQRNSHLTNTLNPL